MAAIVGKDNVLYIVRYNELPYWKIFDNETKKQAGNFIARSKAEDDLSVELSISDLDRALDMLQAGRYVFVASKKFDDKRGGIDTNIEIGVSKGRSDASISGTDAPKTVYHIAGIGELTPENFESALEAKMKKLLADQKAADELAALKAENQELKAEKANNDVWHRNGLIALGATAWPILKKTPAVAEFMGSIGGLIGMAGGAPAGDVPASTAHAGDEAVSGTGNEQEEIAVAVESLADGNPHIARDLAMLAKLRRENPELYSQGLAMIQNMND
jgi:hypothetical protein